MSLSWPIPERASDYFGDYFSFREKAGDSLVSVILSVNSLEKTLVFFLKLTVFMLME